MAVKRFPYILLMLMATLVLSQCGKKKDPLDEPLARVDGIEISQREFLYRTQFFPPPRFETVNGKKEREGLLELLIAEKLMAVAARRAQLDTNASYQEMRRYAETRAALKEFYDDMVRRKVNISKSEIRDVLEKKKKRFTVQVFAARKKELAEQFRRALQDGTSFDEAMRQFYGDALKPQDYTRDVTWGDWIDELEKPLYQMQEGDISPVIKTPDGFVVMRVVSIQPQELPQDRVMMERLRIKVEKTLRKRKADTLTGKFIESYMNDKNVVVKGEVFTALANWLDHILEYQEGAEKLADGKKPGELGADSIKAVFESKLDEPLVTFKGGHFTLREMLNKLRVRRIDFNKTSPLMMRSQLLADIKNIVRDELIAEEARRKGYHKRDKVQREVQMWSSYYLSRLFASQVGLKPQNQPNIVYPDTLQRLRNEIEVWINQTMLDTLYISPNPMFAIEPGRVTHLIVPPWPVL